MLITSMLGMTVAIHKIPLLGDMGISRGTAPLIAATAGIAD